MSPTNPISEKTFPKYSPGAHMRATLHHHTLSALKSGLVPSDAWRMAPHSIRNVQSFVGASEPQVGRHSIASQTRAFQDLSEGTEWIRNSIRETTSFEAVPYPPIDLLTPDCFAIDAHILPERFQLALPDQDVRDNIVRNVLERDLFLTRLRR